MNAAPTPHGQGDRSRGSSAEPGLVECVDAAGRPIGSIEKHRAHRDGVLHRAFSVFIFSSDGRALLQRRAASKATFAGLWSNACCSHPAPGEAVLVASRRRLRLEMGIDTTLTEVTQFTYRSADTRTRLVEHEFDHVLVGTCDDDPRPDPAEVCGWRWVAREALDAELWTDPRAFTPWLLLAWPRVLATAPPALRAPRL